MGTENAIRKTPRVAGQRRRLSDITNTPVLTSYAKPLDENQFSKGCTIQLEKDLIALKKLLKEKEVVIEAQKQNIEKLWMNYCRKSKLNDEIILHNGQLYKDLMQARDKLKVLQHENTQMAAMHKICKTELQVKLTQALEEVSRMQVLSEASTDDKLVFGKQANIPSVLSKLAESRARRMVGEASTDISTESASENPFENLGLGRSSSRRRESKSYREPSLKGKLRKPESTPCQLKGIVNDRKSSMRGLNKVSEEQDFSLPNVSSSDAAGVEQVFSAKETAGSSGGFREAANKDKPLNGSVPEPEGLNASDFKESSSSKVCSEEMAIAVTSFAESYSSGRPLRRAVSSIGSYKEAPLNIKMRRPT